MPRLAMPRLAMPRLAMPRLANTNASTKSGECNEPRSRACFY
jgi:hypothetical protein